MNSIEIPDRLLNEHAVARRLAVSVASVRRWRMLHQGPPFVKIGASVRYDAQELSGWLRTRPMGGELQREVA